MQRRATLRALSRPSQRSSTKEAKASPPDATNALVSLLQGTILRGEGNSCLVLGPRKSGKTMKDSADSGDPSAHPIVIRLSGHVHTNDKVALREIGRQLLLQNGSSALNDEHLDEEDEEADGEDEDERLLNEGCGFSYPPFQPPPSHMSSLITTMSSLPRPTIVILDAFDLFTAHARQALLYCLLDTVQSCRAGEGRKGVAVVGVTTRVDTLNLLEKRVKSRFSHRIIRCPPPTSLDEFSELASAPLTQVSKHLTSQRLEEWKALWGRNVEECLSSREIQRLVKEVFELSRDISLMNSIIVAALLGLHYASPWLSPALLISASRGQRAPDAWASLSDLSFPSLALIVASFHVQTAGHDAFTFEHLHDVYARAARQSTSTNISLEGVLIGLPRLTRDAFQNLIDLKVFQPSGGSSASTSFQFMKYRCDVPRPDIKAAVEAKSHTQLKRWLTRPT
ncbi:hypothetical protein DL93DRAFT_2050058 [Clavulina sp. PMI_390]|nr:hypothetical protein DL93DRAFT_2050058 [Clavulina sp. PMI_390]